MDHRRLRGKILKETSWSPQHLTLTFPGSQLVQIDTLDFIGLDTQVIQGLPLGTVIETDHQFRYPYVKRDSLVISPDFAEGMTGKNTVSKSIPSVTS
jgi:hypothetical protein